MDDLELTLRKQIIGCPIKYCKEQSFEKSCKDNLQLTCYRFQKHIDNLILDLPNKSLKPTP